MDRWKLLALSIYRFSDTTTALSLRRKTEGKHLCSRNKEKRTELPRTKEKKRKTRGVGMFRANKGRGLETRKKEKKK